MADYKIKFEYKGLGKQAGGIRQKVLQSQKGAKREVPSSGSRDTQVIGSMKALNTTLLKLVASNKSLENAVKKSTGFGGGGGPGRRLPGGGGSGGAEIGRIGGTLPLVGAAIAALGFSVQKINQIGNAYIEKAGQQVGNVGVAGFKRGAGVYNAAQMGAGMKAYAMKSGQFANKKRPSRSALNIGAAYGMSSQETLGTAGTFARAGADYGTVAAQAAGRGIQTDVPSLLTGIGGLLEEAIRAGINTSDMSKDIGKEMTALTLKTSGKSAEAALNIVKSFSGVTTQVGKGKIGNLEGLITTQATQNMLVENLTGKNKASYLDRLSEEGMISDSQRQKLSGLKADTGIEGVQKAIGVASTFALTKKTARETDKAKMLRKTMTIRKGMFGRSPEAMHRAMNLYSTQGGALTEDQFLAAWKTESEGEPIDVSKQGKRLIGKRAKDVEISNAGIAVKRQVKRENLVFKYGASFAKASLAMEEAMIKIANKAAPTAASAIEGLAVKIKSLSAAIEKAQISYDQIGKRRTGHIGLDFILGKMLDK